jgi:EpsI family protein
MRVKARLAAAALGFALPALALARWLASGAMASAPIALPALPEAMGPWSLAVESRLSDEHLELIRPDAHLVRRYEAPGRTPLWLYVGLYAGRAGYDAGAHDPEVCYPAQGWEVVGSRSIDVPLGNDGTLRAKLLDAHHGTSRQAVLYWFQPAGRWPAGATAEQVLRIFDAMAGRPQYAFVRLAAPVDGHLDGERDLAEFAARVARPIRAALEADRGGTPEGAWF